MMEGKKTTSPIGIMAGALAAMTERACEAERQRDAAKEDARNWYEGYQRKDAQVKDLELKLETEKEAHRKTRKDLQRALAPVQKGEG